jgi:hypothetical protein
MLVHLARCSFRGAMFNSDLSKPFQALIAFFRVPITKRRAFLGDTSRHRRTSATFG